MNKLVRGIVTGTVIGAGVGLAMLILRSRQHRALNFSPQARGTLQAVKNNALRWGSAVKSGTQAFSRKLAGES